jgi:hypothetical protein
MPLRPHFTVDIVSHVGNYAQIFERNLAPMGLRLGGVRQQSLVQRRPAPRPALSLTPPTRRCGWLSKIVGLEERSERRWFMVGAAPMPWSA